MNRWVRTLTRQERLLGWLIEKLDRRLQNLHDRQWEKEWPLSSEVWPRPVVYDGRHRVAARIVDATRDRSDVELIEEADAIHSSYQRELDEDALKFWSEGGEDSGDNR